MSSPQTTTSDLGAVSAALHAHDRFLLVTHENPDGDALGSLLALKLGLDQLGKDSAMYLFGDVPLPAEYDFMALDELQRRLPEDVSSACSSPSTARTRTGWVTASTSSARSR